MTEEALAQLKEARRLYESRRALDAIAIIESLLRDEPQNPEYLINYALYLRAVGRFDDSMQALGGVPPTIPGYAMLAGWHLLRQGKFLEGQRMREPELGIHRVDETHIFPPEKKLKAGAKITGTTIFYALEGGNGDEIAYLRFVPLLEARGARVIVGSSPEMLPLVERSVKDACPIHAISHDQYDHYLPAMSVVPLLGLTNPWQGLTLPYVQPSETHTKKWRPVIEEASRGRKKIGIQWQGNPAFDFVEFKSIPAPLLAPFAELGTLFSLQRKETLGGNTMPAHVPLIDTQTSAPNWDDTLAILNEMDYVIAGDTTIAHLAGALGKKTLLLLPHAPHPYWADLAEVTSWYPSVRVFRQPRYNDWAGAARTAYEWLKTRN